MDKFDEILASVAKPVNGSCWILTYDKLDQLEGPDIAVSTVYMYCSLTKHMPLFMHSILIPHLRDVRDLPSPPPPPPPHPH